MDDKGISLRIDTALLAEIDRLRGKKSLSEYIRNSLERDVEWGEKIEQAARVLVNVEASMSTSLKDFGFKLEGMSKENHTHLENTNKRIEILEKQISDLIRHTEKVHKLLLGYINLVTTKAAKEELKRTGVLP